MAQLHSLEPALVISAELCKMLLVSMILCLTKYHAHFRCWKPCRQQVPWLQLMLQSSSVSTPITEIGLPDTQKDLWDHLFPAPEGGGLFMNV